MLAFPAAEHKIQLGAAERRREYYEEQSNEYENHLEESRNGKTCLVLISLAPKQKKSHRLINKLTLLSGGVINV